MSRFKEKKRIESAIKNKDQKELLWASDYCKMRIKLANQLGLNAALTKLHSNSWQKILNEIEKVLIK